MSISDEDVRDFIRAYKKEFGDDILFGEAQIMAARLIALYELLARPLRDEARQQNIGDEGDIGDVVAGSEGDFTPPPDPQNPRTSP
jgi:hypothetical protein